MSEQLYRKCAICKGQRIAFEYEPGPNATHSERCRTCDGWGFVPVEVHGARPELRERLIGTVMRIIWGVEDGEDPGSIMPRRAGEAVDAVLAALSEVDHG